MHTFTPHQHRRNNSRTRLFTIPALALALVASACGSSAANDTEASQDTSSAATSAAAPEISDDDPLDDAEPATEADTTEPDAPSDDGESRTSPAETMEWVVALLNDPSPDPAAVEARFSERFLNAVPIEQILGSLPSLQRAGTWSIESLENADFAATAILVATDGSKLDASLNIGSGEPALIEGLLFQPRVETPGVETTASFETALDDFAPLNRAALFEIIDGECIAVIDLGADEIMPIGSIFKLWVLAELAHQINEGAASWDETIPVQDRFKSSPDGAIYQMEEGREISLWKFAAEMISVSDNSATDHLMDRLGRSNVEAAMIRSGVAESERNIPMLSTSDLFRIKFDPTPPNSDDYRALDADGRRALLEEFEPTAAPWVGLDGVPPAVNAEGVTIDLPRDHDLEWFATPLDLCRTHVHLAELASIPGLEEVAEILRMNGGAGVEFDRNIFTDLRFKGGSEQGLVAAAWRMERADGRSFVFAGGVENPDAPINPAQAIGVLAAGANLITTID